MHTRALARLKQQVVRGAPQKSRPRPLGPLLLCLFVSDIGGTSERGKAALAMLKRQVVRGALQKSGAPLGPSLSHWVL